ncbi:MAG: MmgE/PrpD family protein [Myxococcota bacterium]
MGLIEPAAEWIVGLTRSQVPDDVWALALAQRIDILASLYAGACTAAGLGAIAALDRLGEDGPVLTLPDHRGRTLTAACWLYGVLANALELDDFVFAGHTGQAAVGVTLALGQLVDASGEEALLAQIAANEVAGRLGAVMTAGPQHGHMKAYLHRAAAVTAAARLWRLDAPTTARALAIALSAPEYPLFPAAFSADTKVICTGDPIVGGVRAAALAQDGIDAAADIVEHAVGLVTSLSNHPTCPPVWDRLGATWSTQAICFKPVAACAYAAAAAVATAELARDVDPDRITAVEVHTTVLTLTMEGFSRPHDGRITPVNTNFSTRRTVAATLAAGETPRGAHFTPARFAALAPRIAALSERVSLSHHWPLTVGMLRGVDQAIDHPGRPGIYGMNEAHATMARFAAAFGTPPAVRARDLPTLATLPNGDGAYVARRYAVGLRARLPFFGGEAARRAYVSRETDLRRMELRFGARVKLRLGDAAREHEVVVPPGFAGDPERIAVPAQKLRTELGDTPWLALLEQADATPRAIVAAAPRR